MPRATNQEHMPSQQVKSELNHLKCVFTRNKYPADLVRGCLLKKQTRSTATDETSCSDTTATDETSSPATDEKPKVLCLPYIRGLSENIERSCSNLDVKVVFTDKRTLRSLLTHIKGRPARYKVKGVVYKVDCSCGSTYVGETDRTH